MLDKETLLSIEQKVIATAKRAGKLMTDETVTGVYKKEGHANFVTNMDVQVQEAVIKELSGILPEAGIFAEEQDNKKQEGLVWIIDPIDGTNNYIVDYHHSSVSIALADQGEGILGVVYNPYMDEVFYAAKGLGAFLNGVRLAPVPREKARCVVGFGSSPYHIELIDPTFRAVKKVFAEYADVRRSGSAALDLCYVAAGRLDGFFEYILSPWDYAAGSVILKEAGAGIDAISGQTWTFDHPIGICAYGTHLADTLPKLIDDCLREENE